MESLEIDNTTAKHLLRRICKAISKSCGTTVTPNYYSDGTAIIVSSDKEIATLRIPGKTKFAMFFESAANLLNALLSPNALLFFSPFGKSRVEIYVSAMFGTTIEEVKVNLDLLKV